MISVPILLFVFAVATCDRFSFATKDGKVIWSPKNDKIYFPGPISRPDPDKHQQMFTDKYHQLNCNNHLQQHPYNNQQPSNHQANANKNHLNSDEKQQNHNNQQLAPANYQQINLGEKQQDSDNQPLSNSVQRQDLNSVNNEQQKQPQDNDVVPAEICTLTAAPPAYESECCGIEAASHNRIVGGNVTQLEQYPWLVLIEYYNESQDRYKRLCGGFLISGRYVISAAHCFYGDVLELGTPVNVILGDYNATNEGPDCMTTSGGGFACTEGAITVGIESILVHPGHDHNNTVIYNDIALVRLNRTVEYTKYIRPICLPTADVTADIPPDFQLYTAGWGAIKQRLVVEGGRKTFAGEYDHIKRHVDLPYVTHEDCKNIYTFIGKGYLCAGGERGKDSCKGDSGGPLMHENDGIFEAIGIVSTGPIKWPCGKEGYPALYTKVYDYLDWIKKGIQL